VPRNTDESDFIDTEFQAARGSDYRAVQNTPAQRPPSREELESKVQETQQRLEELRQAQLQLEQERTALEEARRRRVEYQTGREEMLRHLIRGVGVLEDAEFKARQEAEQMAQSLKDLREHLAKVQALDEESWVQENYAVELTRALTALENARMEWNAARLKWSLLNEDQAEQLEKESVAVDWAEAVTKLGLMRLCRLGLALTWPVALILLLAASAFAVAIFLQFR
jgi:hypothetical protein